MLNWQAWANFKTSLSVKLSGRGFFFVFYKYAFNYATPCFSNSLILFHPLNSHRSLVFLVELVLL